MREILTFRRLLFLILAAAVLAGCGSTGGGGGGDGEEFDLSIDVDPSGDGSGTVDGAGTYEDGEDADVVVDPDACSEVEWSGPDAAECATGSVAMDSDKMCTAKFVVKDVALVLDRGGSGEGAVSGAGTYRCGDTATVAATESEGSAFADWAGPDRTECMSGSVLMDADKACTALFELLPVELLTVTRSGDGDGIAGAILSGIYCGSDCTQKYQRDTEVRVTAEPEEGSVYVGWTGCDSVEGMTCVVTMDGDRTVDVEFDDETQTTTYTLDLVRAGSGDGTLTGAGTYGEGANVAVGFEAAEGSEFDDWSGPDAAECRTGTVVMDDDKSCTGTFTKLHTLDVAKAGDGTGLVAEMTSIVFCGDSDPGATVCSATIRDGADLELEAIPNPDDGSGFGGWGGDCQAQGLDSTCVLTMNEPKSVTASFTSSPDKFILEVEREGNGAGTVSSVLGDIRCGSTCAVEFDAGTEVTLAADPGAGSVFRGFAEDCVGREACTVTMDRPRTVVAVFDEQACVDGEVTELGLDASAYCRIDAVLDSDTATFEGQEGDEIWLIARGVDGGVSPFLEIRGPSGQKLHEGGCLPDCRASSFNLDPSDGLPETGTYQILVTDSGQNNVGQYELFLTCRAGGCEAPTPLVYDRSAYRRIDFYGIENDLYSFEATAGDEIRVTERGVDGSVSPRLEIRDPNGDVVHVGRCNEGCETSDFSELPSETVPVSGTYTILVSETGQNNWGNYELVVTCLRGSCADPAPLSYDQSVYPSIDAYGLETDLFSFEATAGDQIRVIERGVDGSVSPRLEIRDPSGEVVHVGRCNGGCETSSFSELPTDTVPESGTYTILVSETGRNNWGNYELVVTCLHGSCADPTALSYGQSAYPSIDAYGLETDLFSFEATAGDQIRVIERGVDGSVTPRLEIRDPSGEVVHVGRCRPGCETSSFSELPTDTVPESGTYTILVSESGRNNWGNYELLVDCVLGSCLQPVALSYDAVTAGAIDFYGLDLDVYSFEGVDDTEIRLTARGTSGSVSPRVELRDPDGVLLHAGSCDPGCEPSGFSEVPSSTLSKTGTYHVLVSENNQDNWGSYNLSLACLFGSCD